MKKLFQIGFVIIIFITNCYTSCKDLEDPCDDSRKETTDKVEYLAWGYLKFLDPQGNNVSQNFTGTNCKVTFNKVYCNGNKSDMFEYNYKTLSDGTLDKLGIGSISFDFNNWQDKIEMYFFVSTPDGSSAVGPSLITGLYFVGYDGAYICNPMLQMTIAVDASGNADWNSLTGSWVFNQ